MLEARKDRVPKKGIRVPQNFPEDFKRVLKGSLRLPFNQEGSTRVMRVV